MVVESDPRRLGAAAAAMTLERLDGLQGPPRSVVMPALFEFPRSAGPETGSLETGSPETVSPETVSTVTVT
jgi:hypothetical protein